MSDNPHMDVRASDAERDELVAELREHVVDGRLSMDEFAERMEAAYGSRTRGELEALRHDLPTATALVAPGPRKASRWVVGIMAPSVRRGRWRIAGRTTAVSVMSPMWLDLTQAELDGPEVTVNAFACMGPLQIVVPDDADVDVSGFSMLAPRVHRGDAAPPRAGAPRIHIRAYSLMGPIVVTTKRAVRADDPSRAALPDAPARELGR
jgi:hypothetical protein